LDLSSASNRLAANVKINLFRKASHTCNIPAGNLLMSTATGSLPAKALRVFKTLNCATISKKTYFKPQKKYLHPAVTSA